MKTLAKNRSALHRWLLASKPYSMILLASSALIVLSCLLIMYLSLQSNQNNVAAEQLYGNQLTTLIATQLSYTAATNDGISMQATLNELAENESVITAIIYDVDNRIIVQAGQATGLIEPNLETLRFSKPITLDESLLGRLSIIFSHSKQPRSLIGLTILLLLAFATLLSALLLLIKKYYSHGADTHNTDNEKISSTAFNNINPEDEPIEKKLLSTILLLQFNQMDTMYSQLSGERRSALLNDIQQTITQTLALYGGYQMTVNHDSIVIGFYETESKEETFNALCCGQLLLNIATKKQWLCTPYAIIYQPNVDAINTQWFSALRHLQSLVRTKAMNERLFITELALQTAQVDERISTSTLPRSDIPFLCVTQLSEKYTRLLSRQLLHLGA